MPKSLMPAEEFICFRSVKTVEDISLSFFYENERVKVLGAFAKRILEEAVKVLLESLKGV